MHHHEHIVRRFNESTGLTPNAGVSTMAGDVQSGDGGSSTSNVVKKEGDEVRTGGEENQEMKIANMILRAASGLAKSPAVEEIIKQAEELKRIHGIQ